MIGHDFNRQELAGMTFRILCAALLLAGLALSGVHAEEQKPPDAKNDAKNADGPLYKVVDGTKVDADTFEGFRAWRAAGCDRCHGANQEGLVGPSLIDRLKDLSKQDFVTVVRDGRLDKGMPSFSTSKIVMENIDNLYAYLKGRSDGAITQARVSRIE
jgi:mono/diheme cytochrome c family protein